MMINKRKQFIKNLFLEAFFRFSADMFSSLITRHGTLCMKDEISSELERHPNKKDKLLSPIYTQIIDIFQTYN